MSKTANVCWFLLGMLAYQLITEADFFHWLRPVLCLTVVLMFSSICLLMRPISLFAGLMRRHVGLFSKLSIYIIVGASQCLLFDFTTSCIYYIYILDSYGRAEKIVKLIKDFHEGMSDKVAV